MKKTPILLSTMIIASGGIGVTLPAMIANADSREYSNNVLSNDPLTGESLSMLSESAGRDRTSLTENAPDSIFRFLSVDYKQNQMGVRIMERDDWLIRRIVIAYWDYENGVTEVEADANLATLGVDDGVSWKTLWDYDAKGMPGIYQYATPKDNGVKVYLKDNLTDMVYYAVEYGHRAEENGEWRDTWWERGKINYRNCVHSSVFDAETMVCMRESDGSYSVKLRDGTEVETPVEEIVSWNEEWNVVQDQRYRDAMNQLADLHYNLYNVVKILDGVDRTLARLDVTLPKAEGMKDRDVIMAENARLQDLSRTIREYYMGLNNATLQEELERLRQEKTDWLLEKAVIEEERGKVEQENADLRQEIAALKQVGDGDKGENEDEIGSKIEAKSEEKVEELVATTEARIITVEREKETVENMAVGKNGLGTEETDEATQGSAVEVPNLGDLEEETEMNWWWVLITGVGVLATLALGVGRMFKMNKRK